MERFACLFVSPFHVNPQSSEEDPDRESIGDPSDSDVDFSSVVDHGHGHGSSSVSHSPGGSLRLPGGSLSSPPHQRDATDSDPFLGGWAAEFPPAVRRVIQHELSRSAQSNYAREFSAFVRYCNRRRVAWKDVAVVHVLTFLEESLSAGYAYNTIKGRSAAIKFYFSRSSKKKLTFDNSWKRFMKGIKRLARKPEPKTKSWDPQDMLDHFKGKARPSSIMESGKEAVMLLLLATGLRVDDLHKLSRSCHAVGDTLSLTFFEMRKCPKAHKLIENFYLKRFETKRLCPVRALLHYLKCSEKKRLPSSRGLFVSSKGSDAALWTLRRWATLMLNDAGISASAGSCRAAATSNAIQNGIPVPDVLASAGWTRQSTFQRFYSREIIPARSLLVNK